MDILLLLGRLWRNLSGRRRHQFIALLMMMLVSAFAEVLSLGAVLPFLGVLVSPERVFQQPTLARVAEMVGIVTPRQLVLPLTILFAVVAFAAGVVRLGVLWASTRFSFAVGIDLSIDMYRRTLYQPYSVHVSRNSSEVVSGITTKTSTVVTGVVLPVLFFISSGVVSIGIIVMTLVIDTAVALWAASGFGLSYALVTLLSRKRLAHNSRRIAAEQTELFKTLHEGLGGIRDVLLDGTQGLYCDIYQRADRALRMAQSSNTFISASPRFAMEAFGMALIAFIAYFTVVNSGDLGVALPILGALALGAQRLIPSFQQAYSSWATITGSTASLVDTLQLLDQPLPKEATLPEPAPLAFRNSIRFDRVDFRYTMDGPPVLRGLTFEIPKGARVGIVGATGSGKSTAVDLLMGLLEPTAGEIVIDGGALTTSSRRAWQRTIAHVPQAVYLADASLAENIAFGVRPEAIDMERVRAAARQAQIAEFIEAGPEGYKAMVGERGVRLSGGQRQRIGIARALYKKATVLVFDEATSALDTVTEEAVMDAINGLGPELTIVIVAHRMTTIRNCNPIIEIRHGQAAAKGSFAELLRASETFSAMVRQAH